MTWPGKGPYYTGRRVADARSFFDPTTATPDASFPSTTQMRSYGSATSTPYAYFCDSGNHRIQVTDHDGNPLFTFGSYGTGDGEFDSPYGVANDGTYVYVSDSGNHRIQYFDLEGVYLGQWGSYGTAVGQFSSPKGIATNGAYVFVVDQGNNRFQIFTALGTFVYAYGEYGLGPDPAFLNAPTNCYVDYYFLWIDDTGNGYEKWYALVYPSSDIHGSAVLPGLTISAVVKSNNIRGQVTLVPLRMQSPGATVSTGRVIHGNAVLPGLTMGTGATLVSGHVIHGNAVLPAFTVSARLVTGRNIIGNAVLPAFTVSATVRRGAVIIGAAVLPALTASGTVYTVRATPAFTGMAMNMRNKALTKYNGWQFNSFAVLNGKLYGATSAGIHLVEGVDDNGTDIAALIRTGRFDLHETQVRKLVDAWLSARLTGQMVFYVREGEDDSDDITAYEVAGEDTKIHDERIPFAKGHEDRFVEFEIANVEGADFDIKGLTVRTHDIPRAR